MSTATDFQVALLQKQNAQLRDQLSERDEEIRQLRAELAGPRLLPGWLPYLTGKEQQFLRALASREFLSKEAILIAVYGSTDDAPDVKIVDVFVCKLRRKLATYDITIETVWGKGYRLSRESRQALLAKEAA